MTKAEEKLVAIFEKAPWLKDSKNAVHIPIQGMEKEHQVTWAELHELVQEAQEDRWNKSTWLP